jgi:pimeloyl-ACP methyl ester carboxylesterase
MGCTRLWFVRCLNTEQPNAEDYAQRLADLFECLHIKKAIVVGHSLGALQASAFARRYPDYVETFIIANVAQGYQRYPVEQQAKFITKDQNAGRTWKSGFSAKSWTTFNLFEETSNA